MDWLSILLAFGTILGAVAAYLAWRESHSDRNKTQRLEEIDHAVTPLTAEIQALKLTANHIEEALKNLANVPTSITSLETKMEFLWGQQKQLAMDAARILHAPDPRRSHIDQLLEEFMDDTLSNDGERELRRYLMQIRNWEPGQDVGFPVHPGEQTAAAILLRTMSVAMPSRDLTEEGNDRD